MINTKQVVPALVAVTLLSLAPAAEALAIEEHAQAAKPAAMAADKPAAAKPAEAKADTKKDAKADVKTQAPAATDPAKETPAPSVEQAQKAYDNGSYEEAFIIVEPLAKLEHPDAEYLLGQMYELGRGVKKDTEQAVTLFTSAANQGYAAAHAKLGQLHMEGKKDYASAMSWFQKAADQGYALAYSAIGDLYAQGYGVGQDKGKALDYYKKAATAGDAGACLHLGQMYEQGKDVKADPAQAAVWYKKGADLGSAECAAALKRLNDQKA